MTRGEGAVSVQLSGFGISQFRSFGQEVQLIGPLSKVNLFVGQNNCGKSNVLRFATRHLPGIVKAAQAKQFYNAFEDWDRPLGTQGAPRLHVLGLSFDSEAIRNGELSKLLLKGATNSTANSLIERLFESSEFRDETGIAWIEIEPGSASRSLTCPSTYVDRIRSALSAGDWQKLWSTITHQTGGSLNEHHIPETVLEILRKSLSPLESRVVPAIRRVEGGEQEEIEVNGKGLVEGLARLQHPVAERQSDRARFTAIQEFLRLVLENDSAQLEIPYTHDRFSVHLDGKILPLESLGTGIQQVIILAAAAVLLENKLIAIEEPEIHLHPTLQRRFVQFLLERTSNRYLIASHSAHLLDLDGISAFHVRSADRGTRVARVTSPGGRALVCADLGYRASDLVQANAIVWVEGPTDRLYVRNWIRTVDPSLEEGVHFSIMFYGGRLLAHLTALDPEVEDFISLRRLNRNMAIVIDSDRDGARGRLNATKRRIREEFTRDGGLVWITRGREIENYLSQSDLRRAIASAEGGGSPLGTKSAFEQALRYRRPGKRVLLEANKLRVARAASCQPLDLDVLDLQLRVKELCQFIRAANHR
jgi:hypothetical protein